jgi:hypothetical protein
MTLLPNGNFGIGTTNPVSKLTIQALTNAYGFTHTDGIVTLGSWIGNSAGTPAGWIGTKSNHPLNFFTADLPPQMTLLPNGNFGIGNVNPTNKLQIGSLGNTGFAFNDRAIGNGTNALGIYQSNTATTIASTTDIILNPRNNGQGRVGINTNTPRAPLDVVDEISVSAAPGSGFYSYLNFASFTNRIGAVNTPPLSLVPSVSIIASGRVYAEEFDAYSDARIKDIVGSSSSAKDLETINALQITDYTMRDKVKYGDRPYKKIIAQEVEKVYPQVVSKHKDFVPNVYQATSKMEKVANGFLLHFTNNHNISSNAKKLRGLLSKTERMEEVDIISVPSANEVVINVREIKADKIFIYGEEVDDFRTVDYEGLATLNISATQELSKMIAKQQAQLDAQNLQIIELIQSIQELSN